jgi:hypothetical protein
VASHDWVIDANVSREYCGLETLVINHPVTLKFRNVYCNIKIDTNMLKCRENILKVYIKLLCSALQAAQFPIVSWEFFIDIFLLVVLAGDD